MSNSQKNRIAIVGAGIAGLHAALTLHDAGLSCTVYEASDHIGGRMHSDDTTWGDGMVSEWCGEFIDYGHTTIRALAKRFGLKVVDLEAKTPDDARHIRYYFSRFYQEDEIAREFQKIYPVLQQQYHEVGFPTTYTHFTETASKLDNMSVYDWVAQYVEGGHDTMVGRMLNGGCMGFYGSDTHKQSALNLIYMFASRSDNEDEETKQISGSLQGTSKIVGGNQHLPLAIAATLPEDTIQLHTSLTAIKKNSDNTITLSFTTSTGTSDVTYDSVVLALPFSTLRHVDYQQAAFDTLKQQAIEQLGYGTISKLMLQFDTRYWYAQSLWPSPFDGFAVTDLPIQVLWDTSLGQPGEHGILVDYMGGQYGAAYAPSTPYSDTTSSELVQEYARNSLEQIEQVFPGISKHYTGRAALSYPTGDPHLLGSYSCWHVGQYTRFSGYEKVRQGAIHFAGEHCSIEWQGYMEGAAIEGKRAAHEIIEDYKK